MVHVDPRLSSRATIASCTLSLLCVTACSGGDGGAFGLTQRVQVSGLTFPAGVPLAGSVQPMHAFPNLAFSRPLWVGAPPDGSGRMFVVEQQGMVYCFDNDAQTSTTSTFLDVRSEVLFDAGEQGLVGFAFHPDYATNGVFYTYASIPSPRRTRLSRWTVSSDPNAADPASEKILLEIAQPYTNHNGGTIAFGPDGMLYLSTGDGGSGNDPEGHAQDLTSLLGKILRLTPDGSIPADNPFVGGTAGERAEIWAYGVRNPFRMAFDRVTGTLWLGDVGQNAREEVDILQRGGNYGWRVYEGTRSNINPSSLPASSFQAPVLDYSHSEGSCVIGGTVYRGPTLASLVGAYVYGDFVTGRVWALVHDGTQLISNAQITQMNSPSAFGEDETGELYASSFDGQIYRFAETSGASGTFPATLSDTGLFQSVVTLQPAPGVIEYGVQSRLWSDGARKRRWIALPGKARIAFDPIEAWDFPVGTVLVKHFEIDLAPGVTKRLETRVLLHHASGWQGYTYRWNPQGTEADLLPGSASETLTVELPSGGARVQTWTYPSRTDCASCHTAAAGHVLGVRTRQLNGDFAYAARMDNQLRAWNHIGLFTSKIGTPGMYGRLTDPSDTTQPLEARARSYLAANCAQCHRPGGPTPVDLDLRYGIAVGSMNAVGVLATNPANGDPTMPRITAGDRTRSELWQRMSRRDSFGMPPLGSHVVDQAAVDLIGEWIDTGAN